MIAESFPSQFYSILRLACNDRVSLILSLLRCLYICTAPRPLPVDPSRTRDLDITANGASQSRASFQPSRGYKSLYHDDRNISLLNSLPTTPSKDGRLEADREHRDFRSHDGRLRAGFALTRVGRMQPSSSSKLSKADWPPPRSGRPYGPSPHAPVFCVCFSLQKLGSQL